MWHKGLHAYEVLQSKHQVIKEAKKYILKYEIIEIYNLNDVP